MKLFSTKTHGYLDLMTAGTLLALPRVMKWDAGLTRMLTKAGLGTLGYSMLTRYEFGLVPVLPMRAHLALDALSGATLCAAPLMYPDADQTTKRTLVGLGLFEITAAMTTECEPSTEEYGHELKDRIAALGDKIGRQAAELTHRWARRASEVGHSWADRASETGQAWADGASETGRSWSDRAAKVGEAVQEAIDRMR